MSKNLTRKGLAFAALVALGSTGIAAAPASAAGITGTTKVTLAPSTGTEYTVLTGSQKVFTLTSTVASSIAGSASTGLKWFVNDTASKITFVDANTTGSNSSPTRETNGTYVVTSGALTGNLQLQTLSGEDSTRSVEVVAWFDDNGNSIIDTDEYSQSRTVTFKKASELAVSTTINAVVVGDNAITGKVTTTPALNGQQSTAGDVAVSFTRQGSTATVDANAAWDDTDKVWTASVSLDQTAVTASPWTGYAVVAAGSKKQTSSYAFDKTGGSVDNEVTVTTAANHGIAVGDKFYWDAVSNSLDSTTLLTALTGTDGSTLVFAKNIGAIDVNSTNDAGYIVLDDNSSAIAGTYTAKAKVATVAAGNTATNGASTVTSDDTTLVVAGSANTTPLSATSVDNANNVTVRKDTKSIALSASVVDTSDVAVTAGRPVVISLSNPNEGGQAGTFTVNGKTAPQTVYTDAAGKVSFTVEENDGDVDAQVRVTVTPENVTGAAASADLIWDAAVYTLIDTADVTAVSGTPVAARAIAKNGSHTFNLAAVDAWGALLSGDYRVKAVITGRTANTAFYPLSGGKASIVVKDDAISGDTITAKFSLEVLTSGTWGAATDATVVDLDGEGSENAAITLTAYDQTDAVTVTSSTADQTAKVAAKQLKAHDGRYSTAANPEYTSSNADEVATISGAVEHATTAADHAGVLITVSGDSSLLFTVGDVWAYGSLSFLDADGAYSVDVISNKALKDSVVTVAALGATKTAKVNFAVNNNANAATFAVVAPKLVKAGRTFTVVGTLTDKFGNPLAASASDNSSAATFSVKYSGPGFVSGSTVTSTDVDGQFSFNVLLGSDDSGFGKVVVSYDYDGTGTTYTAATSTTEILVGTSASVSAGKKAATAVVKNALGGTVTVVSGTKSVTKVATSDSYKVSLTKLTAGKKTVKVYVNDVLVASKSVTVKK